MATSDEFHLNCVVTFQIVGIQKVSSFHTLWKFTRFDGFSNLLLLMTRYSSHSGLSNNSATSKTSTVCLLLWFVLKLSFMRHSLHAFHRTGNFGVHSLNSTFCVNYRPEFHAIRALKSITQKQKAMDGSFCKISNDFHLCSMSLRNGKWKKFQQSWNRSENECENLNELTLFLWSTQLYWNVSFTKRERVAWRHKAHPNWAWNSHKNKLQWQIKINKILITISFSLPQ